jgi:hypothetical protein
MKPKPFWVLKNFTVPVAMMAISSRCELKLSERRRERLPASAIETSGFLRGDLADPFRTAPQGKFKKTRFQRPASTQLPD